MFYDHELSLSNEKYRNATTLHLIGGLKKLSETVRCFNHRIAAKLRGAICLSRKN